MRATRHKAPRLHPVRVIALVLLGLAPVAAFSARAEAGPDLAPMLRAGLIRLHVTSQSHDTTSPWQVRRPTTRMARGVVIKPGVILTAASNVRNARMIEFSVANSARRYPAKLRHVDHAIGLALIDIDDEAQSKALRPVTLGDPIALDDEVAIHQLGRDNMLQHFEGRVVKADAWSTSLQLTLKSNCSDRGDGQIALRGGKFVGLVIGTWSSRQEATLLSLETIRRYLDDFADDAYHGCPGRTPWTLGLLREDLRAYYGLAEDQHGVAIRRVPPGTTGDGVLKPDDVMLELDGFDLDDEGKFEHPRHGRLNMGWLMRGRRYTGDAIDAKVLRAGKVIEVSLPLLGRAEGEKQIPNRLETRPRFIVSAGLVMLELTSQSPIGRGAGGVLLRRYRERDGWDLSSTKKRIVYVDRVMADRLNKGLRGIQQVPLTTVNGMPIGSLNDVAKALQSPEGAFHVFRFEGVMTDFVVAASELAELDTRIAETYKIPETRWLGE